MTRRSRAPPCTPTGTSSRCSTRLCATAPPTAAACSSCSAGASPAAGGSASSPAPGGCSSLIRDFRFGDDELRFLRDERVVDAATLDFLEGYRFTGSITGYREGELYFPGSPILTVEGTFAEAVVLETLALSVLNHDSAVATAAARMSVAAGDRPLAEMGSRRAGERSAVAAARAAYIAGFGATSNLEAGRRWGIPTMGTAAHAWTLLHDTEEDAFRAQIDGARRRARPCWSTPTTSTKGVETAIRVAGTEPRRCAHRLRRPSARRGRGARAARRARRDRHEDHRDERPRRVRDRRAGGIPRRLLRRRHLGRHRVGHPHGGHGLQARRAPGCGRRLGRRREDLDRQGVEGRAQGGVPHPRARHGDERAHRGLGRIRRARDDGIAPRRTRAAGAARRRGRDRMPRSKVPPASRPRGSITLGCARSCPCVGSRSAAPIRRSRRSSSTRE